MSHFSTLLCPPLHLLLLFLSSLYPNFQPNHQVDPHPNTYKRKIQIIQYRRKYSCLRLSLCCKLPTGGAHAVKSMFPSSMAPAHRVFQSTFRRYSKQSSSIVSDLDRDTSASTVRTGSLVFIPRSLFPSRSGWRRNRACYSKPGGRDRLSIPYHFSSPLETPHTHFTTKHHTRTSDTVFPTTVLPWI